ncbi:MAG: replicative DNA helicase [Ignavibacteriae bacterium]|jgi:replicative DNA helicase|nr:replicative DNA helicase [Ignavibacteriota bacterium]
MIKKKKNQKDKEILNEEFFDEGRKPPSAIELESQILGAILIDNQVYNEVAQFVNYAHFYRQQNGIIFNAMMSLDGKGEPIDANTLKEELIRLGKLEEAGGIEYIIDLTTSVSTSANTEYYARIIYEKYILRDLIHIASQIVEKCFDPTTNPFGILDDAAKDILDVSESFSKKKVIAIKDEIVKLYEDLGERKALGKSGLPGIPSGFDRLDEMTSGFQNSELIIIAGRPSHGKTALGINIARNAVMDYKKTVAFFSLEMTTREIGTRLISSEALVDGSKLKSGKTSQEEWSRVASAIPKLKLNLFIDDTSELSVLELRAKARRLKQEEGIDMIIVDYLQLLKGQENHERRDLEVAYVSRSLKALAKDLKIPVVACAQLNRGIELRSKENKPQLADLRESGSIEQDADVVIFVHRPFLVKKPDSIDPKYEEIRKQANITIGKQRNGPTGHFDLIFLPEYTRFENVTRAPIADPGDIQDSF